MIIQIGYLVIGCIAVLQLYKIYSVISDVRVDNADKITNAAEINYWVNKEIGNKEREYEALLTIFYSEILNPINQKSNKERYDFFVELYKDSFTSMGKPIPKYPFFD